MSKPDDHPKCHCGERAAVEMSMMTPNECYNVGEWWLCEFHAWEALGAAGIDTTAEAIDFSDDPSEPNEP